MGLDWSTFFLELINFLILVWILKRFLYAPVKAAIEARRRQVESVLTDADARRTEAERMRADYEARLQTWEQERTQARATLDRDLAAERSTRLDALETELKDRRDKASILDERRGHEIERRHQEAALALAAQFATRLLTRLADSALEARLLDLVVEDLQELPEAHRETLAGPAQGEPTRPRVQSAYPLSEAQRRALESALRRTAGRDLHCAFEREPALIAGLRIDAGPLVLSANLRDELRFFAESAEPGADGARSGAADSSERAGTQAPMSPRRVPSTP